MHNHHLLDSFGVENGILYLITKDSDNIHLALKKEGTRIAISASIGPLELALRLYFDEFRRKVANLRPIAGQTAIRQVGGGQAFMGIGMVEDGGLILRPTLVTDASGHLNMNFRTTAEVCEVFANWLEAEV